MIVNTPIAILKSASIARDPLLLEELVRIIESVYRYELFKPLMDIAATLALQKRLILIAEPKQFYALDEGNCITIEGGAFDKFTNIFRSNKNYKITIKKMSHDVFIHEIGHMIENESGIMLDADFNKAIHADISVKHSGNVSLNAAIKQVMIDEVANYNESHKASELFTRFFQLLAMSKQVAGFAAEYGYRVEDIYKAFPNFTKWLNSALYPRLNRRVDPQIAISSKAYIVPLEEVKHEWSKEKVKSIHGAPKPGQTFTKWSRGIKSIKD
ncbi:MAG: hypothetical protein K0R73_1071 [Candidatus Midichloriaceae bacterium]|jgi:hypothetical protein|nr:hypothetical protein [Candidatus Midichloriaceae bacterium]